jgi:hypothetical protein
MSVTNWYKVIPKEYKQAQVKYDSYDKVQIELPMRMLLVGASGSGKTTTAVDMIKNINAWPKIYLFAKNTNQPLYNWLRDVCEITSRKIGTEVLYASEDTDEIPSIEEIEGDEPSLYIFDDLICESKKVLKRIENLYVQGRNKQVSCMFLTQSYFATNKMIRQNSDYIVVKKINSTLDLKRMMKEYQLDDFKPERLIRFHDLIVKQGTENFLLVDLQTSNATLRYRFNYGNDKL